MYTITRIVQLLDNSDNIYSMIRESSKQTHIITPSIYRHSPITSTSLTCIPLTRHVTLIFWSWWVNSWISNWVSTETLTCCLKYAFKNMFKQVFYSLNSYSVRIEIFLYLEMLTNMYRFFYVFLKFYSFSITFYIWIIPIS